MDVPILPSHIVVEAYALGYYHGRAHGTEECPDRYDSLTAWYYREGYESGVAAYCREIESV